jgi:hypothetical protein
MEKYYSAPAKKILDIQSGSDISKQIISLILNFLKNYFGSEILVEMPLGLRYFELEMIRLIKISSKIQEYWNIDIKKTRIPKKYPFIFCYQASIDGRLLSVGGDFFSEKAALEKTIFKATSKFLQYKKKGISIGRSSSEAAVNEILEIIAQSDLKRTIDKKKSPKTVAQDYLVGQDDSITKIIRRFGASDLEFIVYLLPSDFSVYSVLSTIRSKNNNLTDQKNWSGLSSSLDLRSAIIKSISQALSFKIYENSSIGELPKSLNTKLASKIAKGQAINVNLFENQNFFDMPDNRNITSKNHAKILQILSHEFKRNNIILNTKEARFKKLEQFGLHSAEISINKNI